MSVKERIRRTSVTIEFEQVYLNRKAQAFAACETCRQENARLRLIDAIWVLRSVLTQLETSVDHQKDEDICLFCLCSRIVGSNNDIGQVQIEKAVGK